MADRHSFVPMPNGRTRDRDQGERRIRPWYRSTPELCSATWRFSQAEFDAFHDWYEDELEVGTLDFDLRVQLRGAVSGTLAGTTWYTVQLQGEYTAEQLPGLRWLVSATLVLREDLGTVRIPPTIVGGGGIVFGGGGQVGVPGVRGGGAITFGGGGTFGLLPLAGGGGITFGGGGRTAGGLGAAGAREANDGTDRETNDGTTRELN